MRLKKLVYHIYIVIASVLLVACVDGSYRLDDINTEVNIGQGKTTLPLGYLENKQIGDLLDVDKVDGLEIDENGNYIFTYSSESSSIDIEGVEHVVELPAVNSLFEAEYPVFELVDYAREIDETFDIATSFSGAEILSGYSVPVMAGLLITGYEEATVEHHISYEVPEQIAGVEAIYLKPTAPGDPGARIDMTFKLNDLSVVNGGGHVTLELYAPDGYNLYDSNKEHIANGVFNVNEFDFEAGENELNFVAYIASIDNIDAVENGVLDMPIVLEYHLSYEMTTTDGTVKLTTGPQLHIAADLAYDNADIVLNATTLFDHNIPTGGDMEINNLPQEILSIKEITFAEDSPMVLYASGFDWMSEELASAVIIDAWLPDYVILHDDINIGYNASEHRLHTTLSTLRHGVCVDLDAIEFEGNGATVTNGSLGISFTPDIVARIEQGTVVRLSDIQHDGAMTIEAGVEAARLDIRHLSGYVDYSYKKSLQFELTGLEDLDVEIDGIGLLPVLTINVVNPLTIDAILNIDVAAVIDGQESENQRIGIGDVVIEAATVVGGTVEPTRTTLIIADESQRAQYESENVTFIPRDVATLVNGDIPNVFNLNIAFHTDAEQLSTLYTADNYNITYDYQLSLPLSVNDELSLSYSDEITGLRETFENLSSIANFKVGDVAVIVKVVNTTPFAFGAEVELIDSNGNPTEVQVRVPEDTIIYGSKDGVSAVESTFRMELLLEDGDVSAIGNIDGLRFTLEAESMAEGSVSINEEQYVGLQTYLEVDGGITIDFAN